MNFLRSVSERLRNINSHFINEVMRSERLSLVGSMANTIIHDLKNPMCIVRCCVGLIERQTADPQMREVTRMLDDAVNGMLSMGQELLDYARGGDVSLNKKLVTIWALLHELNKQSLRQLPDKNIQVAERLGYEGPVDIDLPRFSRVLCNLIKNSREAMRQGSVLTFSSALDGNEVVLQISDTGCGIPAALLSQLFEPFVTRGKSEGTGLGLAIAKSIVQAHGGKIQITSQEGRGTTVEIRLPRPASPDSPAL